MSDVSFEHMMFFAPSADRTDAPAPYVFVEADRFWEARELARKILGGTEDPACVRIPKTPKKPLPRWQIRWTGFAALNPPTLVMEARLLMNEQQTGGWRPFRDV